MTRFLASGLLCSLVLGALAIGDDVPPDSTKLSKVLDSVAKAGYKSITEASFDDGSWEVEALKDGKPVGLRVAAESGKVLSEYTDEPHPALPADARSMSAIVQLLEKSGYTSLRKAEFETTGWDVEAVHEGSLRELVLDLDGKIVSDRPEN